MEVIDRSACVVPPGGMCRPPVVESLLAPTVVGTIRAIPASLCQSIDRTCLLTFVVRGDGYPCAGGSWSQLSVGLLNHGVKARTRAFLRAIGMAVTGDKDMVALGPIWAEVLQVCSLHFHVHRLFIIRAFIIRKTAVIKRRVADLPIRSAF